jgi:hypothetical protein
MLTGWRVNYAAILAWAKHSGVRDLKAYLAEQLPDEWCRIYYQKFPGSEIVEVLQGAYHYLFDLRGERVVAAYGISGERPGGGKRQDHSRRRGWAGRSITSYYAVPVDKGHFMSDAAGGGSDINLFVQRRDLNQGRSDQGKQYTKLEKFCQTNPGTFCFSRGLYVGSEQNPSGLEFGILRDPRQFRLDFEVFDNSFG